MRAVPFRFPSWQLSVLVVLLCAEARRQDAGL